MSTPLKLNKYSSAERVIVALDVQTLAEAEALVKRLSSQIRVFKVGSELFTAEGTDVVSMIHGRGGRVFLDLKFHDIPNTVAGAIRSASRMGVFMMNVHAAGGYEMMAAAHKAVQDSPGRPLVIAVTVLTSMNEKDLKGVGIQSKPAAQVLRLAKLARKARLDGVVCSGEEIGILRKHLGPDFALVVPGIRPAWSLAQDQKRVVTPRIAFERGASFIVVGRPITQHKDPREAASKLLEEIRHD